LTESAALIGDCREVIVTGFTNYAMPLLRYRTGDMVRRFEESCPRCGRHHHFVGNIDGRVNAFLFDSDGRVAPQLYQLIRFFPNVRQCQFYQDEPGKAQLRVVRAEKYSERDTPDILSRIRATLGPMKDTLDIKIVFFDEIPKTSSGKIKVIDQKLDVRTFLSV
jgi:phenylacetate-CoA ligase